MAGILDGGGHSANRAATTIYGYRKIIDNHLSDALGSVPIQKLTPQHLQQYYSMLMRDKGLSANTVRRHHDLLSCALHMALPAGHHSPLSHRAGGAAPGHPP